MEVLGTLGFIKQFYPGGGTAVAIHLAHRRSRDFDFFSPKSFSTKSVLAELRKQGRVKVSLEASDTLTVLFKGVPCGFFEYPYPVLGRPKPSPWSVRVAGLPDIAAMKISSIAGRGTKRDFVDLYFICREAFNLEKALGYFEEKFRGVTYDPYHLLRSLAFFDDAEKDRMPVMLKKVKWDDVKQFFRQEVLELFRKGRGK